MTNENIKKLQRIAKALRENNTQMSNYLADDIAEVLGSEGAEDGLDRAEVAFVQSGSPIQAIKAVRARFANTDDIRGTLQGAKDFVEAEAQKMGYFDPNSSQRWKTGFKVV